MTLGISNLIGNAIKYVDSGGMIEVNVEEDDENLIIAVCDNGIGIHET
ncbi:MAG: ATP-binding protein [Ignavibacteriales bacterium]|nr:ATP-binding protein [Ignavibacteriales bacterium]